MSKKDMEIRLDKNDDPFFKYYKIYIDSITSYDKHKLNQGIKFFLEQWLTYLKKLDKEDRTKLIENPDYLSHTMNKFLENNHFIKSFYWNSFDFELYDILEELWSEEYKDLFDVIRNSMDKAIYNLHGLSINRIIRNLINYLSGDTEYYGHYKIKETNPYKDLDIREEEREYTGGRTYTREVMNADYIDFFGINEAFKNSECNRLSKRYKKMVMENSITD